MLVVWQDFQFLCCRGPKAGNGIAGHQDSSGRGSRECSRHTRSIVAALAALVLDVDAMEAVKERGEATTLFDACLSLIVRAWDYLSPDTPVGPPPPPPYSILPKYPK